MAMPVICNPKAGLHETLPYINRCRKSYSFFGFDPISKKCKALFMAYPSGPDDHRIMTLGTRGMRWRKIKCSLIHEGVSQGVSINGVLYYLGDTSAYEVSEGKSTLAIVCFDVRAENFKFIYLESCCELINYKGKLGVIYRDNITDDTMELCVWVLEDVEKQEWSKYAYILKGDNFFPEYVSVVGVISTGEIMFSMADYISKQPFYVFYFNLERKTLQRVEIQGFGEYRDTSRPNYHMKAHVFSDHIDDLNVNYPKLLKSSIYAPRLICFSLKF
ncbi:unnamed protein product [Eruca vesicaria subsp. sativa]|uniref:F-box associated beta-propeller type 3 domain-containing protein n=1 Tax=Eruca vesicaria subsp. sativa TaxID=29727 RepID=A0ABC8K8S2_ERUVS|nr:unnamed protein product [Eruca vesicaria subsp. sativa]